MPFLLGVALGDLLAGLPIDSKEKFTGDFWDLLTPYGLWMGLTVLVLCLLHGATFISLKALGPVRDRSHALAGRLAWPALALVVVFAVWTVSISDGGIWRILAAAVPVLGGPRCGGLDPRAPRRAGLRRDGGRHRRARSRRCSPTSTRT